MESKSIRNPLKMAQNGAERRVHRALRVVPGPHKEFPVARTARECRAVEPRARTQPVAHVAHHVVEADLVHLDGQDPGLQGARESLKHA